MAEVALNQQANIHFSMERGMRIMNYVHFFGHKGTISAINKLRVYW
jgi:hypothetical protein